MTFKLEYALGQDLNSEQVKRAATHLAGDGGDSVRETVVSVWKDRTLATEYAEEFLHQLGVTSWEDVPASLEPKWDLSCGWDMFSVLMSPREILGQDPYWAETDSHADYYKVWANPEGTATIVLNSGEYEVVVINDNGCSQSIGFYQTESEAMAAVDGDRLNQPNLPIGEK